MLRYAIKDFDPPEGIGCHATSSLYTSSTTVDTNALCSYPLIKVEIGDSSKFSTTAPIFSRYNYFRQTIWRLASVQFHF